MEQAHVTPVKRVGAEWTHLDLRDKRLDRRGLFIAGRVATAPGRTFPQLFPDRAELEAFYRFVENPYFGFEDLLKPHLHATRRRVSERGEVLVVHDTTEFSFGGEHVRAGLGPLRSKGQGFFAHASLAVSADGTRDPLGLVNLLLWTRAREGEKTSSQWPFVEKEMERWQMVPSTHRRGCWIGQTGRFT